jgi:hypothetical protein
MLPPKVPVNEFEIAPDVTNVDWQSLNLTSASPKEDWEQATGMFQKRVNRFLEPVRALMQSSDSTTLVYAGFATIAVDCLLIETLQSFRTGRPNPEKSNDRLSKKTFVDFLTQRNSFKTFFDDASKAGLFFDHFRCGILHQGEVKSSGRIRIDTPTMVSPSHDNQSFIINRWLFHEALVTEVGKYKQELIEGKDATLRDNFIKKMNEISRI